MMDSVALAYLRYNISCEKMEVSWYRTMRREICIKPLRLNPSSPGCLAVITVRQMQRIAQWHFYCAASWELRFWIIALLSEKKQLLWSVIKLLAPPHRGSSALFWFTIRHFDKNREIGWNGEWTISNLTPFSCKIGQTYVLFSFILPCCSCCCVFSPTLSVGVIILLFAAILMFVPILQCAAVGCFSLIFPLEDHNSLYNVSGIFYSNSSPSAPRERTGCVYPSVSVCSHDIKQA